MVWNLKLELSNQVLFKFFWVKWLPGILQYRQTAELWDH